MVPFQDGLTDGRQCRHCGPGSERSGAPDSLRAGLADPPEDWPAASPCDAAAAIRLDWFAALCNVCGTHL